MTTLTTESFKLLAKNGLSTNQGWCIVLLRRGNLTLTELARAINVSTAAMTGIMDGLCGKGIASRVGHDTDRRSVVATLTDEGIKIVDAL